MPRKGIFQSSLSLVGLYVDMDVCTREKKSLDVGRVLVSTTVLEATNKVLGVIINGSTFSIRLMEDVFRFNELKLCSESCKHHCESSSFAGYVLDGDNSLVVPETVVNGIWQPQIKGPGWVWAVWNQAGLRHVGIYNILMG